MNLRISVNEADHFSMCSRSAGVSSCCDAAKVGVSHPASSIYCELNCVVRRAVIGDDDFDAIRTKLEPVARDLHSPEKSWQVGRFVESGNDERNGRCLHDSMTVSTTVG